MSNYKEDLKKVKAFVFDVDGVFSSAKVSLHPSGDIMRTMNIKDGYAIHLAVKKNYPICIISGGTSESVRTRFKNLGLTDIYLGASYKMDCFNEFIHSYSLEPEDILYMGDDIPDFEVMREVGCPVCPADAAEEIKSISKYISAINGGEGCVRDIVQQVLKVQGNWMDDDAFTW